MCPGETGLSPFSTANGWRGSLGIGEAGTEATGSTTEEEVGSYLAEIMSVFSTSASAYAPGYLRDSAAHEIFEILTARRFSHLSRSGTMPYRERALALLEEGVRRGEPISFWYDVGPGYHATTRPDAGGLRFEVALSELLILFQIASFCDRVGEIYAPGARFWLVVDNLCALRTNEIPVESTASYCEGFRELIRELRLEDRVALTVESEEFDLAEYDRMLEGIDVRPTASPPSVDDVENVERFLGRRCSVCEAAERIERYRRTCVVTEHLLTRVVRGVRLTQRASQNTLGFRAFPGGDSRTQCGEVAIGRNAKRKLCPLLVTSKNVDDYVCTVISAPAELPSMIAEITYAEPRRAHWPAITLT